MSVDQLIIVQHRSFLNSSISAVIHSMDVVMIGITGGVGDAQINHRHTLHGTTMTLMHLSDRYVVPVQRERNRT